MEPELVNEEEKPFLKIKEKLGFDEWLSVSWSLYWRYMIGLFCLLVLVVIFGIVSSLAVKLTAAGLPILYRNILNVTLIGIVFFFFFILINMLVLKWFFRTTFNGFKIGIINNIETSFEITVNKIDWIKIFWSFLWRSLILSIGIFLVTLIVKLIIGVALYKSTVMTIIVPGSMDYQMLNLEVFVNAVGFYIGFLSNIILIKWLFSLKNEKYKLSFVYFDKDLLKPIRNSLMSAILIVFFIGGILNAFVNFFAFDLVKENAPYVLLYSQTDSFLFAGLSIITAILVIPVWLWKKWGVYLLLIAFLISIVASLIVGSSIFILSPCIVTFFVFIYLVKKQWDEFE
jgi:hypothetical protein